MEIDLPEDVQEYLSAAVEEGLYASAAEAITALLRASEEHDRWLASTRESIRRGLADSKAGRVVDGPAAMAEILDDIRTGRLLEG